MSEYPTTEEMSREDRAIFAALERTAAGGQDTLAGPRQAGPRQAGADDKLVREYLEVLGLLPYGLDPVAPAAGTKARLLAEIDGATPAEPPRQPAPATAGERTVAEPVPSNVVPMVRPSRVLPAPSFNPWIAALAATLAFCLVGLGYFAGRLKEQNLMLARLGAEMRVQPGTELVALQEELSTMKRRFHMVASIARKAYHMEGVERVGNQQMPAEGVVYVCGNHQRWYLNLQGLEPPPAGKEYNLWFLTEDGMVNGGVVDVRPDASSEKDAQSMPMGTHGFAITLEVAGPHDEPEGLMVLLGKEAVSL